jgi:hypothetical protein
MGRGDMMPDREPDMRRTVKKIVKFQPPCTAELVAMLDCMKVGAAAALPHTVTHCPTCMTYPALALTLCTETPWNRG